MDKLVYTRVEVAKMLGVALSTVDRMIREGELKSFRPSPRRVLITAQSLADYLAKKSA